MMISDVRWSFAAHPELVEGGSGERPLSSDGLDRFNIYRLSFLMLSLPYVSSLNHSQDIIIFIIVRMGSPSHPALSFDKLRMSGIKLHLFNVPDLRTNAIFKNK
jgi:hypothetical protein